MPVDVRLHPRQQQLVPFVEVDEDVADVPVPILESELPVELRRRQGVQERLQGLILLTAGFDQLRLRRRSAHASTLGVRESPVNPRALAFRASGALRIVQRGARGSPGSRWHRPAVVRPCTGGLRARFSRPSAGDRPRRGTGGAGGRPAPGAGGPCGHRLRSEGRDPAFGCQQLPDRGQPAWAGGAATDRSGAAAPAVRRRPSGSAWSASPLDCAIDGARSQRRESEHLDGDGDDLARMGFSRDSPYLACVSRTPRSGRTQGLHRSLGRPRSRPSPSQRGSETERHDDTARP